MRKFIVAFAAVALGVSGFARPSPARAATPHLIVHTYDIGQGSCVLVECPNDLPILVDCGKMKTGGGAISTAARKINTVLDGYRDTYQPLRVILSHGDLDHYSLLNARGSDRGYLVDPGKVRQIYFGGRWADYGSANAWMNAAHRRLSWPPSDYPADRPCDTEARISCLTPNESAWGAVRSISCGAAKLDLLTANAQQHYLANRAGYPGTNWTSDGNKNGDSVVVRVSFDGVSFIITGDAQEMTEQLAVRNAQAAGQNLRGAGFVYGSHHGARTHGSNGVAWIKAVAPRFVIFSANLGGGHGHPTCEVVRRFDDEADAAMADAPGGDMAVRCDHKLDPTPFRNRFLVTEANGDITVTIKAGTPPVIACARRTEACDWD